MDEQTPRNKPQKFSFRSLFKNYPNGVTIPKIQRDYAQGRQSEKVIRDNFIASLYKALANDGITLDFIYGSREKDSLLPLDGQQRLTTLFLLHWLAATREGIDQRESDFLKNFKYETRPDTELFCQLLRKWREKCDVGKISHSIKNSPDYLLSWDHDPTISAMLVMLDALDEQFYIKNPPIEKLWEKLDNINFYCTDINELGETDDIYIKMNSSGRPLTDFEHFKSRFDDVTNSVLQNEIDGKWTDFLWKLFMPKEDSGDTVNIDAPFLNLFRYLASILTLKNANEMPPDNNMEMVEKVFASKENVDSLKSFFDAWSSCPDPAALFNSFLTLNEDDERINIATQETNLLNFFATLRDGEKRLFLKERLYLWALTLFLQNRAVLTDEDFKRRFRILRNLAENSPNETRTDNMSVLLEDTENLILHGTLNTQRPSFSANQKEEEQRKLDWIAALPAQDALEHEEKLARFENRNILYGSTSLVGVENYDLFDVFLQFFSIKNNPEWNSLGRALLSCGNFYQAETAHMWRAGGNKPESWRNLLSPRYDTSKRDYYIRIMRNFLDALNKNGSPQKVIDAYLAASRQTMDWNYYIVRYPLISERSRDAKYYWRDPNKEYVFYSMATPASIAGRHWQGLLLPVWEHFANKGENVKLGDYGQRLLFPDRLLALDNFNDHYLLSKIENDDTFSPVGIFRIPQQKNVDKDGKESFIDLVDRISFICQALRYFFRTGQSAISHSASLSDTNAQTDSSPQN